MTNTERVKTPMSKRMAVERKAVSAMIRLFCRARHAQADGLCAECSELEQYAHSRLQHCPFKDKKPACSKCPVHCYKPEMRKQIRIVMQYAGPRMPCSHPILSLRHALGRVLR
jgi:hypothetical protein